MDYLVLLDVLIKKIKKTKTAVLVFSDNKNKVDLGYLFD
tara:strand:- start:13211 stop:13327 length:117 start_codon:yes stop_codon:yes gene_type:complete